VVAAYHYRLGLALEDLGRADEALAAHSRALAMGGIVEARAGFARALAAARRGPGDAAFRALVTRAVAEAWARPADLAGPAIALVRADPVLREAIDRAQLEGLAPQAADALLADPRVAAALLDPLLLAVLENAQACDWGLERFLTALREALLRAA